VRWLPPADDVCDVLVRTAPRDASTGSSVSGCSVILCRPCGASSCAQSLVLSLVSGCTAGVSSLVLYPNICLYKTAIVLPPPSTPHPDFRWDVALVGKKNVEDGVQLWYGWRR